MQKQYIQTSVFFVALILLLLSFLFTTRYFLEPIFYAALIAVLSYPMHRKFVKLLRGKQKIAALFSIVALLLFIFVPLVIILSWLVRDSITLYNNAQRSITEWFSLIQEYIKNAASSLPPELRDTDMFEWRSSTINIVQMITNFIFTQLQSLTRNIIAFFFKLSIMFFALFYFYTDGPRFVKKLMKLSPLSTRDENLFLRQFVSISKAIVLGTLMVGVAQGGLGALALAIVGISSPVFWGFIMMILSIIPGAAAAFVWIPAAVILIIQGKIFAGLFLTIFGILVIGLVDDYLRPFLVGRRSNIHPLLVLISTLGGAAALGLSGFIIGPIITALLLTFLHIYEKRYA